MNLVDLEYANEYFSNRPYSDEWTKLPDESKKQQFLAFASKTLFYSFRWHDDVFRNVEGLWVYPDAIRDAVCETALYQIRSGDPTIYPEALTQGVSQGSVGSGAASATMNKDFVAPIVPSIAVNMLTGMGDLIEAGKGVFNPQTEISA